MPYRLGSDIMQQLKRLRLLGLAFMAIAAFASVASATASAEELPNILACGTEAEPVTATTESGSSSFGSGATSITASSSLGTLSATSCKLGLIHLSLLNLKLGSTVCTGLGDEAGVALILGQYHIRDAKVGAKLVVVEAFLFEDVHATCGLILFLVGGCLAGTILPESTLAKELTIGLNVIGSDNEVITILKEVAGSGEEACQLLAQVNEGASALSSQQALLKLTGFKQNGAAVEALVMPL
jgi:hypothetical protein